MNFLNAIRHAAIGYGIRRKMWRANQDAILSLDNNCDLRWLTPRHNNEADDICRLLGPDLSFDLREEDIKATDWETV